MKRATMKKNRSRKSKATSRRVLRGGGVVCGDEVSITNAIKSGKQWERTSKGTAKIVCNTKKPTFDGITMYNNARKITRKRR
jgi:hypothetical protein